MDSGHSLIEASVDGEAIRFAPPPRFRILPAALRVRLPLDAPGASPAALSPAGTRATVVAPFRVVRGRESR